MIRVLVAEDQSAVRAGLVLILGRAPECRNALVRPSCTIR